MTPREFNDRLLLGLKGTMSEAELHFIRARLRGGDLSKARRGELRMPLPVGLVYDPAGNVVLDPDRGVQHAMRHLFATFERTGSARAVVHEFNRDGWCSPTRCGPAQRNGELAWNAAPPLARAPHMHNPRYAGAFAYGRQTDPENAEGEDQIQDCPANNGRHCSRTAHPGYLTFEQYEQNLRPLANNAQAHGTERAAGPAREGPALLQGLAICGRCGRRMTIRYHQRRGNEVPDYQCMGECIQDARTALPGRPRARRRPHDQPAAAPDRHAARAGGRAHRPSRTRSPRRRSRPAPRNSRPARPPTRRARPPPLPLGRPRQPPRRRHPRSRLERQTPPAPSRPRQLRTRHRHRARPAHRPAQDPDPPARRRLPQALVRPDTPQRERKRIARLLIEDVTLNKTDQIHLHVRFRGGQATSLTIPIPPRAWHLRQTEPRHARAAAPAAQRAHRRRGRREAQRRRPPLRRRQNVHRQDRARTTPLPRLPQPPRTAPRPRSAHHRRARRPARRSPDNHQRLAPRRPDPVAQGQRQEHPTVRPAGPRRSATRQTPRTPARSTRTHPTMYGRCTMKPTPCRSSPQPSPSRPRRRPWRSAW